MKAVQIVNPSEMKVVELEKPTVGAGEVLVRIKYVGFCGSDLNTFLGRNPMVKLPSVRIMTVSATKRTSLHKNQKTYSRTIQSTHTLKGMNISFCHITLPHGMCA